MVMPRSTRQLDELASDTLLDRWGWEAREDLLVPVRDSDLPDGWSAIFDVAASRDEDPDQDLLVVTYKGVRIG